jgi:peptidyl-prolyl cis-trans isomerase C
MNNTKRSRSICALAAALTTGLSASFAVAETIATVNGVDIDSSTLNLYLESRMQKPASQVTPAERDSVLEELTDIYILTTQPQAKELAEDDRIKAQIELGYRGALAQAVATNYLASNPATDDEILAEYSLQVKLSPSQQFKARHILVETQSTASDLIVELNDGADFAELAIANSTGPSAPNGGDLGWFAPNQMVESFSQAVASLEDGAYTTEPVQTEFGWHVILREDSRANEPPTLDSVRDVIKQRVEQENFQRYIQGLRESLGS